MDDTAYVSELFGILTNPAPTGIDPDDPYGQADDGIDRYDGFGRDVRVTSARVVPGEHGHRWSRSASCSRCPTTRSGRGWLAKGRSPCRWTRSGGG